MFVPRVFQIAALMADMPDVLISGIDFLSSLGNWNVVSMGVIDQILTGLEIPCSPRCYDLHGRVQSLDGGLESYLIVALAGAAVSDGEGAFLLCYLYQLLGHKRSCHGCAEEVVVFIYGAGFNSRIDIICDEFLSDINCDRLRCASCYRFLLYCIEVFSLSCVAAYGDDFAVIFLDQPG